MTAEQLEKIKDNFIFISPAFGKEEAFNKNTLTWGSHSIVINEFILEDYGIVYQALSQIQSSMPIKLARKLQNMVCNFVYSAEAQNNILFGDINSPDIDDEKAAIYFGRADTVTQIGFSYFSIDEILEDILFDNKPYLVNKQLIEKTFKNIRSSAGSTLLPIYKYVKALGYDWDDIPSKYNIIDGYDDPDIRPTSSDKKNYIKKGITFHSIKEIEEKYPGNYDKIAKMAIIYDGQVKMANLAICAGYSVNGVAKLHTEILEKQELKDFYEMMPQKFNNKTNGITQRRFLLHGNPLLAEWVTNKVGDDWITDLPKIKGIEVYADDKKAQAEFMNIKYQNKVRLAKYIKKHNGVDVDPRSIFDVQVKRLHEYKRQLLNILHVMYLYNQIKEHPDMEFIPRTFIFGAKAAAGYKIAKLTIKLINSVADVINNDESINGKIKVVFIENYRVSNAEIIFAAADVSEQISTASKEASGTGNMKFMLNGALTLGTMDGANVEIVEEVGKENAFIFGMSSDEVIGYENNGGYDPMQIFNSDMDIRKVLMQLINGFYSPDNPERFRPIYNSLLTKEETGCADRYFILKDFQSYAEAQRRVEAAYKDEAGWAKSAMLNVANVGKFTSDITI